MKTRSELEKAWANEKPMPSGYRACPAGWTVEDMRELARAGVCKLSAGRHHFTRRHVVTARERGMAWKLV